MQKFAVLYAFLWFGHSIHLPAQEVTPVIFKGAIKEKKVLMHKNIIQNTINKNLSLPLNAVTEEYWADAFWGMELLHYHSPWADGRINMAFDSIGKRSSYFQKTLLELAYANYADRYLKQVLSLLHQTKDMKTFALCAEYIIKNQVAKLPAFKEDEKRQQLVKDEKDEAIAHQLFERIKNLQKKSQLIPSSALMSPEFLPNKTILFSFQRKNRNYPGLAVIRDSTGRFLTEPGGAIFSVPQLARSLSNLPGYLSNGNTPQGIFRMFGLDTSASTFIGPTANIQLTMPFETSLAHFFGDSTITDTVWTEKWYKKLLPGSLKKYNALYESFYAGMAGRNEIIAHGTTVDPEYYRNQVYYPQTPTMGCLCTKESWSETDGKRIYSDQEKLVLALESVGGANGYCVVIEIDDALKPVTLDDLNWWLKNDSHEK